MANKGVKRANDFASRVYRTTKHHALFDDVTDAIRSMEGGKRALVPSFATVSSGEKSWRLAKLADIRRSPRGADPFSRLAPDEPARFIPSSRDVIHERNREKKITARLSLTLFTSANSLTKLAVRLRAAH